MSTFDRLAALSACLCQQITTDGIPPVSFCTVVPGEAAAADYFNCSSGSGMAWVRLINAYPSTSVGTADTSIGNCSKDIGFDVELGIMRCYAGVADANGRPPKANVVREAAAAQMMDMETMLRAINCCNEVHSKDYVVGQYSPLGPEGGVVGGIWTISMI